MATIGRAKADGHAFIIAGQSQGTWQIHEDGIRWLREYGYPPPANWGERLHGVPGWVYSDLKAQGFLDTKDEDASTSPDQPNSAVSGSQLSLLLSISCGSLKLQLDLPQMAASSLTDTDLQRGKLCVRSGDSEQIVELDVLAGRHISVPVLPSIAPYTVTAHNVPPGIDVSQWTCGAPGLHPIRGAIFIQRNKQFAAQRPKGKSDIDPETDKLFWVRQLQGAYTSKQKWPGTEERIGKLEGGWECVRLDFPPNVLQQQYDRWLQQFDVQIAVKPLFNPMLQSLPIGMRGNESVFPLGESVVVQFNKRAGYDHHNVIMTLNGKNLRSRQWTCDAPTGTIPADALRVPGKYEVSLRLNHPISMEDPEPIPFVMQPVKPQAPAWLRPINIRVMLPHEAPRCLTSNEVISICPDEAQKMELTVSPSDIPIRWRIRGSPWCRLKDSLLIIPKRVAESLEQDRSADVVFDAGGYGFHTIHFVLGRHRWWLEKEYVTRLKWITAISSSKHATGKMPGELRDRIKQAITDAPEEVQALGQKLLTRKSTPAMYPHLNHWLQSIGL